jgi:hypothetical protein
MKSLLRHPGENRDPRAPEIPGFRLPPDSGRGGFSAAWLVREYGGRNACRRRTKYRMAPILGILFMT